MMAKKRKSSFRKFKVVLPYLLASVLTLVLVFVGTLDKNSSSLNGSLESIEANDYKVSVDQLSELYVVADLSNVLNLASASGMASNYVTATTMYNAGISMGGKPEKLSLTGVTGSRGVIEITVEEGDSIDAIASKYGVSTDQIRWSNGLKTNDITVGSTLYIPSQSGIVYTVKPGETAETIAEKYGSSAEEIIAMNDLEISGLSEGSKILIKDGNLPETERPEYVAPVAPRRAATQSYTYTYMGDTSSRSNATCNRAMGAGQCTTWGWLKRPDLGFIKANANRWDDMARAAGLRVDHAPSAGAIFQSDSGWYGHVGYVESVNADGSINVSERNYSGCYGVLYSTIQASEVGKFNYIH